MNKRVQFLKLESEKGYERRSWTWPSEISSVSSVTDRIMTFGKCLIYTIKCLNSRWAKYSSCESKVITVVHLKKQDITYV